MRFCNTTLDLATRATRDHVELAVLVGKPHGRWNANAIFAKGGEEDELVGRQVGKGIGWLFQFLCFFGGHVVFLIIHWYDYTLVRHGSHERDRSSLTA